MSAWVLHHTTAMCQDCEWSRELHGPQGNHGGVLTSALSHARRKHHYVQVERGQHIHYGGTGTEEQKKT